jgi:anthranilate/para-aminobenzoate synthase component I
MPTQELRLERDPSELLNSGPWPRAFALDGSGADSWGGGFALFGHTPRATLRVDAASTAYLSGVGTSCSRPVEDPLVCLEQFRRRQAARMIDEPPGPFAGGLLLVLSYDLKHWIERVPCRARDDQPLPVLECSWYDWALVFDYRARRYQLASAYLDNDQLTRIGREIVDRTRQAGGVTAPAPTRITSNFRRADYVGAVRRALEYIAAGDIYQVNLAQRFATAEHSAAAATAPAALFARLQRLHPMPFAAFIDCDDFAIVSNSPECLVRVTPDTIATFPIKGTRPRGANEVQDAAHAQALRKDPKEAAEHVMIVDLERNDLGRVCQPGSIAVGSFAAVHSYPTVHHLVSQVHGCLRPGTTLPEILRAVFPGGSITGAPKIRAMEIIDELEPVRRGIYTGSIGFVDGRGNGVLNIAIRTALAYGGRFTYHAGGAVVADSDPQREYDETLVKARAFFDACGDGRAIEGGATR